MPAGFSFLARKILKSAGIVTKITQSRAELSIGESSKWGSVVHQYYLDGAMHTGVDYSGRRIRTISHILCARSVPRRHTPTLDCPRCIFVTFCAYVGV